MANTYLLFYNAMSALGWAFVLLTLIQSFINNDTGQKLWSNLYLTITVVQTAAVLEILHSLFGLVRSPLLPTILQVGSRLIVLWLYMMPTDGSSGHWSLYLAIGSWSLVEIPRYLFYMIALIVQGESHKINSLLFYLRYHLFMVLYPSGITGELLIMYHAYGYSSATLFLRSVLVHNLLYLPVAPMMVMNMWWNKNRAYKKRRRSANPRPLNGLIWPVTDANGNRSTTKTNRAIWTTSMANVDTKRSGDCAREKNWRFGYHKHVMNNVVVSCQSVTNALRVANDGLDKAYQLFEFKRGQETTSFAKVMTKGFIMDSYDTHIITGHKYGHSFTELEVPYGGTQGKPYYLGKHNKTVVSGLQLRQQLGRWVNYGTIEPSAAESISMVNSNRTRWLDLKDHYFILLGATSAMGPLYFLLEHGANVIAVDLDRDFIWKKLFNAVRNSNGRLILPVKQDRGGLDLAHAGDDELAKISGSDLLSNTPQIANWLTQVIQTIVKDKPLTIGNYTYLDGALHVQLSLACDAIIKRVCDERADTKIAFLCTPTDNHVIPIGAYNAARESFKSRAPGWATVLNSLLCGKLLSAPNYKCVQSVPQSSGDAIHIIDGIAVAQGPNYALAKRLQHWRAVIAYHNGHVVSSNVAPSTATMSVVHNAQFAAAYGGMHHFAPMEVMYQRTSLAVMGSLLIHDIRNRESAANPKSKIGKALRNPFELFSYGSFHGGVWRCSYKINDIGVPSALAFYIANYKPYVSIGLLSLLFGTGWLITGFHFS